MAYLTLLDLANRQGSDPVVGLIEEVLTVAPEFQTLPTRPIAGTSFRATLRTGRASAAFRNVNEGVTPSKSTYTQKVVPMHFMDTQLEVDEAIVKGDDRELGDILADEATGAVQDGFVHVGSQIYYGKSNDSKGFSGLVANVDSSMEVDAGGVGNDTTSIWFVWEHVQGLHIPVGNNGALDLGDWTKQRITRDSKNLMAHVNNFSGYLGLSIGSKYSIGRIKNVDAGAPVTDELGAKLYKLFKVGRKPTTCFMTPNAKFLLQKSRSSLGNTASDATGNAFSPIPTHLAGVPIVETDSITDTEIAS